MTTDEPSLEGCTLEDYANAKRLDVAFLKSLGLSDTTYPSSSGVPAVCIPYLDSTDAILCTQYRVGLAERSNGGADRRFRFKHGDRLHPYGLWLLENARRLGHVVLCEGVSDAQTLLCHGIPALGLPGALWREEWSSYLDGIEDIVLVIEPDQGGKSVESQFARSYLRERIRAVRMPPKTKGPSELYLEDPEHFKVRWQQLLEAARPLDGRMGRPPIARAQRLTRYSNADGLEKNCAQLLPLGPRGRRAWRPAWLRGQPERAVGTMQDKPVFMKGSFLGLSAAAFPCLAFLHAKYVRQGGPASGEVEFTVDELVEAAGERAAGSAMTVAGRLLDELMAGSFKGLLARHDGTCADGELRAIEWFVISRHGLCWAALPNFVADNLRNDFTAYLDRETMVSLRRENPEAMRLWLYAEAQNLTRSPYAKEGLKRCIFPQRYTGKNRSLTINSLLSQGKANPTRAVERIHAAVDIVNAIDPRYELRVERGKSWLVVFKRRDAAK